MISLLRHDVFVKLNSFCVFVEGALLGVMDCLWLLIGLQKEIFTLMSLHKRRATSICVLIFYIFCCVGFVYSEVHLCGFLLSCSHLLLV